MVPGGGEPGQDVPVQYIVLCYYKAVRCRFVPSARLRSLAVVSLGKMCLQHEAQAGALKLTPRLTLNS